MTDTKLVKLAAEHWVCSVLAGHGWGVALTRDGLEHADILGVHASTRRMIEVQVKAASFMPWPNWPLNSKAQEIAKSNHEWFALVALGQSHPEETRGFVVPRDHIAAAAWITHQDWRTDPTVPTGKRNAEIDRARVQTSVFNLYLARWDLLLQPSDAVPVLLPQRYRELALDERVGLPPGHPWATQLPEW